MIEVEIGGRGRLSLSHLVLDVNGTLAVDGRLIDGVPERLAELRERLAIHLITADTHGGQAAIDAQLGLKAQRMTPGDEAAQKAALVESLGASGVAAIGNGSNDAGMLKAAAIGIAVIGREGASREAIDSADLVVAGITDALDLLLIPKRLIATLRK